jgi:hypothetical protein
MTTELMINGKKYIVPHEVIENSHKHHEPNKWVALWFYKDAKKELVLPNEISSDIITSKSEYQKDIFYKMSFVSAADDCFDYYFKLKDKVPKNIVKKNSKFSNKKVKKRTRRKKHSNSFKFVKKKYPKSKDGKFVVSFE